MKKYLKYLPIAIAVLFLSAVIGLYQQRAFGARPDGMSVSKCQNATTSAVYKIAGAASSTCEIDITHASALDLNIFLDSTTTPPTMFFKIETTSDPDPATRNWYAYKYPSTSGVIQTWGTGDYLNSLTYASSTEYNRIPLEDVRGERMRITYSLSGAAGLIYIEAAKDND